MSRRLITRQTNTRENEVSMGEEQKLRKLNANRPSIEKVDLNITLIVWDIIKNLSLNIKIS